MPTASNISSYHGGKGKHSKTLSARSRAEKVWGTVSEPCLLTFE